MIDYWALELEPRFRFSLLVWWPYSGTTTIPVAEPSEEGRIHYHTILPLLTFYTAYFFHSDHFPTRSIDINESEKRTRTADTKKKYS